MAKELSSYQTQWIEDHNKVSVVYRGTEIVRYEKTTGELTLDTGGWFSVTTKNKMNQSADKFCIPFSVHQKKGKWYVTWNGETFNPFDGYTGVFLSGKVVIPFNDITELNKQRGF